jgi:predicted ribosome quality control (RQC) complex YloA/Tae2 family protein
VNDQTITRIVEEIAPVLLGRAFGKVFVLSRASVAIDFRPGDGRYLFLSVEPSEPKIYLIERRVRDLEKQSLPPTPFALVLRKQLGGATLASLTKVASDRIVRFAFDAQDDIGNARARELVAQLTGKAANLLLLDGRGFILDTLRQPRGEGQEIGERYEPPATLVRLAVAPKIEPFALGEFNTLSAAADDYYRALALSRAFAARASSARTRLHKEIAQREKLKRHLAADLSGHGDAMEHKRIGDLLLANIGSAERSGHLVKLRDYYADDAPVIEVVVEENKTLQEEAAQRFSRYAKAKRAAQEIKARVETIEKELAGLRAREAELETIISEEDEEALAAFSGEKKTERQPKTRQKSPDNVQGARRFRSSDGYEILVGRQARDNDHLTFRLARPHDLWLHAADYPGSHVIVRNSTRAEIPHRTIVEAAQLAAAYSQARRDSKVDVHYTQRKFLSKPKGAAPGLVRMSSFRTLTVEPSASLERL